MQLGRRVGILPAEGLDDPLADHAAVFVVGLGQHQNELGNTAPGGDVSLAQTAADQIQQVFHHPVQAALGQLSAGLAGNGEKADVDGVAAAQNGAGLGVIQDFEEVVLCLLYTSDAADDQ